MRHLLVVDPDEEMASLAINAFSEVFPVDGVVEKNGGVMAAKATLEADAFQVVGIIFCLAIGSGRSEAVQEFFSKSTGGSKG